MMDQFETAPGFDDLAHQAALVIETFAAKGLKIATAESCTGGMIGAMLTEVAGSSAVVDRGFITYSNEAKMEMLGVPEEDLISFGAVSEPVAKAMAKGALTRSDASIAVSVTGIAGPGGGSVTKPVGTVCFGLATTVGDGLVITSTMHFPDVGRRGIRFLTVQKAFNLFLKAAGQSTN